LTKFDIRSPGIADRYPMRILWVEDRIDHVVQEGDVVAVYSTPKEDPRRMTAPFTGKVTRVFVTRGAMLKGPTALVEFARHEEPAPQNPVEEVADIEPARAAEPPPHAEKDAASVKSPDEAAPRRLRRMLDPAAIDAIFDRILGPRIADGADTAPLSKKPRGRSLTLIEVLLILCLTVVGAAIYVWKERPDLLAIFEGGPGAYTGPLSRQAADGRQLDPALLAEMRAMKPFGVGQGTLEIFRTPEDKEFVYCPAVVVGPNIVAFARTCGGSVLDAAGGVAPTGYFRTRRMRGDTLESLVYPVTEIHRWRGEGDTGMVSLAVLRPADGGSVTDDTGRSGFAVIDTDSPPPYLRFEAAPSSPASELVSRGCEYFSETAPVRDAGNGLHSLTVDSPAYCVGASESGYVRMPIDGALYFGGFYSTVTQTIETGDSTGAFPVARAQLFGSRDDERLKIARDGTVPPGSERVALSGLPFASGIYLANACDDDVTFYFMEPGSGLMQNLELSGYEETRVGNATFAGVFLYSIGEGSLADPEARPIEFNGKTYYMRRANAVRGDVVLRAPRC
jgi:hypothetical protein